MFAVVPLVLFLGLIVVIMIQSKINFIKSRNSSEKILAEVVEYRTEKGPMRNDYSQMEYPYVRIDLESDEYILQKLRYANNISRSFKKGQQIHVFWNGNDLLYWDSYNKGFFKHLPEKWFWQSKISDLS